MPAAVPAVWAEAGGRRDLESVRSKRLAVCNIQPRRHCSLAGNPGVLLDPLRWPLELWGSRGWVSRPGCRHAWSHPCGPPAHPASCSTLPRPSCSPAAGALQAAGAAGLWGQAPRSEDRRGCGHPLAHPSLADWSSRGGPGTHRSFCNTLPRPWCSPTGQQVEAAGARPGWAGPRGPGPGQARGLGAAGSSVSSRRPRRRWGQRRQQRLYLQAEGVRAKQWPSNRPLPTALLRSLYSLGS